MIARGGGGYILSGTRVEEGETETKPWSEGRKKRKVQVDGSEMEDVRTDSALETDGTNAE
jgi:hypothetical protein